MTPDQREDGARADARTMCDTARIIVARGNPEFVDDGDPRGRLAAKALVVDLASALQRAPRWRDENPALWRGLERTRDRFARHYLDIQLDILWEVIADDFVRLGETLGDES